MVLPLFMALAAFLMLGAPSLLAAPPIVTGCGEHLAISDRITVTEGEYLDVTIEAADPDGDQLTWSSDSLPEWLSLDPETGRLTGWAPVWADDPQERNQQFGAYDIIVSVTDGTWTVQHPITVEVLDASWQPMTLQELIAAHPTQEGYQIHTPAELRNVTETIITSQFGGGARLRKVCFGFTSQVPVGVGEPDDWASELSCAYLPADGPTVPNAGAVVEGCYSGDFGETYLAEKVAAELGIPVLIIDRDWDWSHPGDLMDSYDQAAAAARDPRLLFYFYSTYHYLRAADALVTVIESTTSWEVDIETFRVVYTGFSKFGHTAFLTAGADPSRTVGVLAAGSSELDGEAARILATLQGGQAMHPEAHPGYLGTMLRAYATDRYSQALANPETVVLPVLGTNDHRSEVENYTAKYICLATDRLLKLPSIRGILPNGTHTTQTPIHAIGWEMLLAHIFLGRPVAKIESAVVRPSGDGLIVSVSISGDTEIELVNVWATSADDRVPGGWDSFVSYHATGQGGNRFTAEVPANTKTFFVEVKDSAQGVEGLVYFPPQPVDLDYPLLQIAPRDVTVQSVTEDDDGWSITWELPESPDLAGVLVVGSSDHPPANPLDGVVVYDGSGSQASVPPDIRYVTLFTYDATGAYSPGVARALGRDVSRRPRGRIGREGGRS